MPVAANAPRSPGDPVGVGLEAWTTTHAIKFDTTVAQLLVLNPGVQPTNLTVGQRIRVK